MGGRHFIVTQSLRKMAETKKEAVFNDCDYRRLSDNENISLEYMKTFDKTDRENKNLYDDTINKVINADAIVDLGLTELKVFQNGNARQVKSKAEMKQSVIIPLSRKAMEYQRFIWNCQIECAKDMLPGIDPELYKKGSNDVTRFITRKDKKKTKGKGEEIYCLNEDRIREEEKYDGFYAIATNMPCDTAEKVKKIIAISEGRNKIEECLRIMKTDFNGCPADCQTKGHITAHFMTCYTALLIYRLLEVKLNQYERTIAAGAEHYTTENILETLKNMNVVNIQDLYYTAAYKGSRTLNALCGIYDLGLDHRNYRPKDPNKRLKKMR
jgi:transposase